LQDRERDGEAGTGECRNLDKIRKHDDDNDEHFGRNMDIVNLPVMISFHTKNILNITFRLL
jgi:hypothetical protein